MKYLCNSKFDFGLYKGYDIGIVYMFDYKYLEWCIFNIDNFYIEDLDELLKYDVITNRLIEGKRDYIPPEFITGIDIFNSFDELIAKIGDKMKIEESGGKIKFSTDAILINKKRIL